MIEIDKGVELPPRARGKGAGVKYPFADLKIGDSFFVPLASGRTQYTHVNAVGGSARSWARTQGNGFEFAVRREGDKGARVWRTA